MTFLDDYEPVDARLEKFWAAHPTGRVHTDRRDAPDGEVVFYAAVYRDLADEVPYSTGWAHEVVGQGNVNRTSALENCETSAIGRALANGGFAAKGPRPSREEMTKAAPVELAGMDAQAELKERLVALGDTAKQAWKEAGLPALAHLPVDRLPEANALLERLEVDDPGDWEEPF